MDAAKTMSSLRRIDEQYLKKSALSRLHPLSHLIVTLSFIVAVVSLPKYSIGTLTPFFVYPVFAVIAAGIPAPLILKRVALIMPIPFFLGIFNPFLDTNIAVFAGVTVSAGWLSLSGLMLKCALTVTSALLLICITGISGICSALDTLKIPRPLIAQISFTYRYIYVLGSEVVGVLSAYRLRAPKRRGVFPKEFGSMCGSLFLRSIKRAEDIYAAMRCRGFNGVLPMASSKPFSFYDAGYVVVWVVAFVVLRFYF